MSQNIQKCNVKPPWKIPQLYWSHKNQCHLVSALFDSGRTGDRIDVLSPKIRIPEETCPVQLCLDTYFSYFYSEYYSNASNLHSILSIYPQSNVHSSQIQDFVCSSSSGNRLRIFFFFLMRNFSQNLFNTLLCKCLNAKWQILILCLPSSSDTLTE